jgi:MYXO-CTERM domain-containing protein
MFGKFHVAHGLALSAIFLAGGSAMAGTAYNFNIYANNSGATPAGALGGYFVTGDDSSVVFNFGNLMGRGSITNIYFESGLSAYLASPTLDFEGAGPIGKQFSLIDPPGTPINASTLSWTGTSYEVATDNWVSGLGVESDRLSVSFNLVGTNFNDFTAMLEMSGTRVAAGAVIGGEVANIAGATGPGLSVAEGEDDDGGSNAVPMPSAAMGGLAMLGLAALKRRRPA